MNDRLLIYGASGFTGRLILEEALARGLRPVIGGRTLHKLETLARADQLECRSAALDDRDRLAAILEGIDVVLNAAGPFVTTALPLAQACIERKVHYLDISGEFAAIESLAALSDRALRKGAMLLAGVGFDVIPSDCAAALVAARVSNARRLSIALRGLNAISRGSADTVFAHFAELVTVRRSGRLIQVTPGELVRDFDFGDGPRKTTAVSWADVSSAYYTTGIPDITVYYDATPLVEAGLSLKRNAGWLLNTSGWRWWQGALMRLLPEEPSQQERATGQAAIVAHAVNAQGEEATVTVYTPEVYSFTAVAAAATADRVLNGEYAPGFQTPARVYGPEYGLSLPGVTYVESPPAR